MKKKILPKGDKLKGTNRQIESAKRQGKKRSAMNLAKLLSTLK